LPKLLNSILKRDKHKTPRFLRDNKPDPKLWNEMLKEVKR